MAEGQEGQAARLGERAIGMDEKRTEQEGKQVNLLSAVRFVLGHFYLVLLAGLIAGGCTFAAIKLFVTPIYESSVSFYVYNSAAETSNRTVNSADLEAAESLATTYSKILGSNTVLDAVLEDLGNNGNDLSRKELSEMVNASVVTNTQLLEVVVSSSNARLACDIADSYAKVAPDEMERITKVGGVEVVDQPEIAEEPTSPRVVFDSAIGVAVGFIISIIILIFRMLSDKTIYLPEDIEEITVLGSIPEIESSKAAENYWKIRRKNLKNEKAD